MGLGQVDSPSDTLSSDEKKPLTQQWYFWVAVGGGALLIIIVAVGSAFAAKSCRSRKKAKADADNQGFQFSSVYEVGLHLHHHVESPWHCHYCLSGH